MYRVFCFKQKTAYEMRISDWSSDVCSSDLETAQVFFERDGQRFFRTGDLGYYDEEGYFFIVDRLKRMINASGYKVRSEEHTSELQSLMRISYAVFCLKNNI